jgi:transposase
MAREHHCSWRELAERREQELKDAEAKITTLQAQIERYERQLFGRKTERLPPVDKELRDKSRKQRPDTDAPPKKRTRKSREELSIRTEIVNHPVFDSSRRCTHCGRMTEPVGNGKYTIEWEYVPGYLLKRIHIQETVACSCGSYIVRSEPAIRVFDRCHYGPGLIAYLIVSKCADSTPIYRIEKQFERQGIPIARSTLNDLVHRAGGLLKPLYDRILELIVADPHTQADETSFRLHNRPDKRGFVWTFLTDQLTAYAFSGDRSGDTPARILGGSRGKLVVDGYTGYNNVTDVNGRERSGCWSHARRYWFEALPTAPQSREVLDMILELFEVERTAKERGIVGTQAHLQLRRQRSQPVLDRIHAWLLAQEPFCNPQSPAYAAIRYCKNQWKHLTVFMRDPQVPIHNNASESALRVIALGRKNFMFFGNEDAARNFSVLYSLVISCERNGLDPIDYIKSMLIYLQTWPANRIDELLPHRWKPPPSAPDKPIAEAQA